MFHITLVLNNVHMMAYLAGIYSCLSGCRSADDLPADFSRSGGRVNGFVRY